MIALSPSSGTILALQSLNALQGQALTSQMQMATGKQINSPADDGAAYIIATNLNVEKADNDTIMGGLLRGQSLVDVASAAAQSIQDTLQQMAAKAVALTDTSLDTASRTALQNDLGALAQSIGTAASQAGFNGINLLDAPTQSAQSLGSPVGALTQSGTASINVSQDAGLLDLQLHVSNATAQNIDINWGDGTSYDSTNNTPGSPQSYSTDITHTYAGSLQGRTATLDISATGTGSPVGFQVPSATFTPSNSTSIPIDASGTTLDLAHYDLSLNGLGLSGIGQMTGSAAVTGVDAAMSSVSQALDYFGEQQSTLGRLVTGNTQRSDALQAAIGNITDADMASVAAKSQAIQTKQALAVQALNIGNAQSGMLLQLFKTA